MVMMVVLMRVLVVVLVVRRKIRMPVAEGSRQGGRWDDGTPHTGQLYGRHWQWGQPGGRTTVGTGQRVLVERGRRQRRWRSHTRPHW